MTRPVRRFPTCPGPSRVGPVQEVVVRTLTGRNGSGQELFECDGSVPVTLTRPAPPRPDLTRPDLVGRCAASLLPPVRKTFTGCIARPRPPFPPRSDYVRHPLKTPLTFVGAPVGADPGTGCLSGSSAAGSSPTSPTAGPEGCANRRSAAIPKECRGQKNEALWNGGKEGRGGEEGKSHGQEQNKKKMNT